VAVALAAPGYPVLDRKFAMTITSRELLDTSKAQLQTLAAFLADQLGECDDVPEAAAAETRACRELLLSLEALIAGLQRHVMSEGQAPRRSRRQVAAERTKAVA
jgi:hypothetical protein